VIGRVEATQIGQKWGQKDRKRHRQSDKIRSLTDGLKKAIFTKTMDKPSQGGTKRYALKQK
jgi:hypothetical protein